jgi:hypothetical protein
LKLRCRVQLNRCQKRKKMNNEYARNLLSGLTYSEHDPAEDEARKSKDGRERTQKACAPRAQRGWHREKESARQLAKKKKN